MSIHLRQNPSVLRRTIRMDPPPIVLLFWPEARSCKCHVCWFDFVFLQQFLWGSNWENNVSQDRLSTMRTVDQKFCQQQNNIHYHYYYYTTIIIIIVIMIHICTVCGDVPDQTLRLIQGVRMLSQPWGMDCCCGTVLQQMVLQFYRWWWWWPVENMYCMSDRSRLSVGVLVSAEHLLKVLWVHCIIHTSPHCTGPLVVNVQSCTPWNTYIPYVNCSFCPVSCFGTACCVNQRWFPQRDVCLPVSCHSQCKPVSLLDSTLCLPSPRHLDIVHGSVYSNTVSVKRLPPCTVSSLSYCVDLWPHQHVYRVFSFFFFGKLWSHLDSMRDKIEKEVKEEDGRAVRTRCRLLKYSSNTGPERRHFTTVRTLYVLTWKNTVSVTL